MKPPMPVGVIVIPAALQKTLGDDASRDLAAVLKETVAASAEAAASSVSVEVSRLAGAVEDLKEELKGDIARVDAGLRTEIGRAEENLRREFATNLEAGLHKTKGSIVCWVVGLALAQAALTVALFQLLR